MGDYRKYYGCIAVCSNGSVIEFKDLYSANNISGISTFASCCDCGCPMNYNASADIYKCPRCGQKISHSDVMLAMDADNKKWEQDFLGDYDDIY